MKQNEIDKQREHELKKLEVELEAKRKLAQAEKEMELKRTTADIELKIKAEMGQKCLELEKQFGVPITRHTPTQASQTGTSKIRWKYFEVARILGLF